MTHTLSVDVAHCSGWCITDSSGCYVDSGECDAFSPEATEICKRVVELDGKARLVLEKPSHGNRAQLVGMGAARGGWLTAWYTANNGAKRMRIKDVFPVTWRSALFGDTSKNPTRERLAAQVFTRKHVCGPDESAAVCIGIWAARKAQLDAVMKKAIAGAKKARRAEA